MGLPVHGFIFTTSSLKEVDLTLYRDLQKNPLWFFLGKEKMFPLVGEVWGGAGQGGIANPNS